VLPNPDRIFTPGLYARVQLEGSADLTAILIDDKAVMTDQDRKYVYVVGPGNKAVRKDVTLGDFADELRIVPPASMRTTRSSSPAYRRSSSRIRR